MLAVPAAFAPPAVAAARIHQLVVFKSGAARQSQPLRAGAIARVGRKRCAVAAGTPLAALIRSGIGPLSIRDYGSCGKRAANSSSLFVSAIGSNRNRGMDGWVYKSGNVLGTAGSGDPSGPLGRGLLRGGAHVTWFWCHVSARNGGCPHTLGISVRSTGAGVAVQVRQYNDQGKGRSAVGATVHVGRRTARTGSRGGATVRAPRGHYSVWATQPGRIRSFSTPAEVR
jgi:hypothetical protein